MDVVGWLSLRGCGSTARLAGRGREEGGGGARGCGQRGRGLGGGTGDVGASGEDVRERGGGGSQRDEEICSRDGEMDDSFSFAAIGH